MKKLNTKGFAAIEGVLLFVIVALIAGVGYYVYSQNQDETSQPQSSNTTETATSGESEQSKIDTTIYEVDIKMETAEDIDKLPSYTPASFKAYLLDILNKNKFEYNRIDDVNTIAQYQISKISQVNISGGVVPVDKNGEGHAGGAPAIWVLTPNGDWDQESLNGPVCESKNGGLIYEEFTETCYTDRDNPTENTWAKNPNGSIKSLDN